MENKDKIVELTKELIKAANQESKKPGDINIDNLIGATPNLDKAAEEIKPLLTEEEEEAVLLKIDEAKWDNERMKQILELAGAFAKGALA